MQLGTIRILRILKKAPKLRDNGQMVLNAENERVNMYNMESKNNSPHEQNRDEIVENVNFNIGMEKVSRPV